MAVCLQHEIDHLHGVTMLDHLRPLKRAAKMHELEEALAAGARPGDTSVA
jgi:peptide deformylase